MGRLESGFYPPGAEHDRNAPWNERDEVCEECGEGDCDCAESAAQDRADAEREERLLEEIDSNEAADAYERRGEPSSIGDDDGDDPPGMYPSDM